MPILATRNAKPKPPTDPARLDPSRTGLLRKQFAGEVRKRFNRIKRMILRLVVEEDAFGLKRTNNQPLFNTRWRFLSSENQLAAFESWLMQQMAAEVLEDGKPDAYWKAYVNRAFKQGQSRAFDDVKRGAAQPADKLDFYKGTKTEFLESAFHRPVAVEKVKLLAARAFTDLQGVNENLAKAIKRDLIDGFSRGDNPRDIAKRMTAAVDKLGINRAEAIARTEVIRSFAEGQLDSLERLGVDQIGVAVEWSTAGDGRQCVLCSAMEGAVFSVKDSHGLIPRHPNCLPGDCLVLPRSRIAAASKRWFDGDFIVIKTASDRELTCTPNHPILTNLGWVPAQELDLFCQVVCDGGSEWKRFIDGNNENAPSQIHKVAESFLRSGKVVSVPVPLSAEDFHGDGEESQIAVVGTDRQLLPHEYASSLQGLADQELCARCSQLLLLTSAGSLGFLKDGNISATSCSMSGGNLQSSGLLIHETPLDSFGFGLIPQGNATILEPLVNDVSGDIELIRELVHGLPQEIFLDDVVHIKRYPVSCHVYNLQTENGWYVANGIITHNCRCAFLPANVGEPTAEQKRTKKEIAEAVKTSIAREIPKRTKRSLAEQRALSRWAGADTKPAKAPTSILDKPLAKQKDAQDKPRIPKTAAEAKTVRVRIGGAGRFGRVRQVYRVDSINWIKDDLQGERAVIIADPKKLDAWWKATNPDFYIPPGGGGAEIGGRIQRFQEFLEEDPNRPIEMPRIDVLPKSSQFNDTGKHLVGFSNGRHRFTVFRDMGKAGVAVQVDRAQAKLAQKLFGIE